MSESTRLFSVDAANRLVPLLQTTFETVRIHREELARHVEALEELGYDFSGEIASSEVPDGSEAERRFRRCTEVQGEIARVLSVLAELGVEIKGLNGLVDVRSHYEERIVYLCWKEGEKAFSFWHELDGGLAGRRPITEPEAFEGTLLN